MVDAYMWYGGRTDLGVLRLCLQNVAVSKSHHRLLFHPIMEKEKEQKKPFFEILSTGGRLSKGKVLAPFISVVFHGLLGTCSF